MTKCCVGQHPWFFTIDLHIVFIALSWPKTKAWTHFWQIGAVQRCCLTAESWFCLFVTNGLRRWYVLKWCRREAVTMLAATTRMLNSCILWKWVNNSKIYFLMKNSLLLRLYNSENAWGYTQLNNKNKDEIIVIRCSSTSS